MKVFAAALLLLVSTGVHADIEKVAIPSDHGSETVWWPKLVPPTGWHFDRASSYYLGFYAMAPDGSSFAQADTVIYAMARPKREAPDSPTLQSFVASDIANFKDGDPGLIVAQQPPMQSADGTPFQVLFYHPPVGAPGDWERVAYGEEGEFYVTFVVSAQSQAALQAALPTFTKLLTTYRARP
ncbi:hypothetical protein [Solimonas marina]|uniref:DUF1795 domain-containing protein n=1 Tax=Solimonas marina TaxID=2714601 RepID=A0A969WDU1_9GAMM|nr:hypothetical protein [Solimonas marina]NKF24763.1 hypothetical protein [Solimonas marina]